LPQTVSIQWKNPNKNYKICLHFNNVIKLHIADSMTVFNSVTLIVRYLIYHFKGIICGINLFHVAGVLLRNNESDSIKDVG
jgi:hypothetical protein